VRLGRLGSALLSGLQEPLHACGAGGAGGLSAARWGLDSAPGPGEQCRLLHVGITRTHLRLEATPAPQEVLPPDSGAESVPNQGLDQRLNQELISGRLDVKASAGAFQVSALRGAPRPAMVWRVG